MEITPSGDFSDEYLTFEIHVPPGSYVSEITMRGPNLYKSFKISQMKGKDLYEVERYKTYEPLLYSCTKERLMSIERIAGIKFDRLDHVLLGITVNELRVIINKPVLYKYRYYPLVVPRFWVFSNNISKGIFMDLSHIRKEVEELLLLANKYDEKSIWYEIPKDLIKFIFSFCGYFVIKMNFDEPVKDVSKYSLLLDMVNVSDAN